MHYTVCSNPEFMATISKDSFSILKLDNVNTESVSVPKFPPVTWKSGGRVKTQDTVQNISRDIGGGNEQQIQSLPLCPPNSNLQTQGGPWNPKIVFKGNTDIDKSLLISPNHAMIYLMLM